VITDSRAVLPDDRVQAVAGCDGTAAYDAEAYVKLLEKAACILLTPLGLGQDDLKDLVRWQVGRGSCRETQESGICPKDSLDFT
jgi:hypothetical protein